MAFKVARTADIASGWPPRRSRTVIHLAKRRPRPTSATRPAGTDGHTVAERLGHRHDVGHHALALEREPSARPPEAGLDLIDHQENSAFGTKFACLGEESRRRRYHAVFPFDHLEEQSGDHARVERRVERRHVTEADVAKALGERREGLVLGRLPGRMQGGERAPMKRAVSGDDRVATPAAESTRELDRTLVSLGSGVGEKDLATGRCLVADQPVQRLCNLLVQTGLEQVRDVEQRRGLLGNRAGLDLGVGMTERDDGDTR